MSQRNNGSTSTAMPTLYNAHRLYRMYNNMYGKHMRFQQKQLLEREKRKLDIAATLNSSNTAATGLAATEAAKTISNGKVRQMFDERRRGAGIDRSHPLKPIAKPGHAHNEHTAEDSLDSKSRVMQRRNMTVTNIKNTDERNNNLNRGRLSKSFSKLSLQDIKAAPVTAGSGDRNNNRDVVGAGNTARRAAPVNNIKLKPVVVRKTQNSPPVTNASRSQSSKDTTPVSSARGSASSPKHSTAYPKPANRVGAKSSTGKITLSVKPPPRVVTPPPGMATCPYCSRNFVQDRLVKHEQICQKMMTKQRKIFDATKQRVRGTEVEPYVKRQLKSGGSLAAKTPTSTAKQQPAKKSNWRQKHEEFLAAVRSARKVQAHLAKGGKITDLPPPPPSENPDYVQCPHCLRRFNEAAAERHIPKCATMQHNKPKPAQKLKKR